LCRRPAKGVGSALPVAAKAVLVESESFAVDLKKFFLRFPILSFAAHTLAKNCGVQLPFPCVANSMQDAICLCRQLLAQSVFEVRRNASGKAQHAHEGLGGAGFLRAL